ncbi:MAG: radical protein [Paenibacillaceae bacterium]|nr:radical protein [Paenibacillaceae bacterium]
MRSVQQPVPRRHIQYEEIRAKTILNKVNAPSMPFEWSINPYRGCQHGCSFCYARATHTFLGMDADDTFQNHILMKKNAAEALEEQLSRMARSRGGLSRVGQVAIGTATDPYQPAEAKEGITRQCLEVLAKYRVPTSITTRSPLILRDLDVLVRMPILSVNFSANTLNYRVWRNMEPSTPAPLKRLEAVRELTDAGIPAGIFMAPILPWLTDSAADLQALFEAAADHRAQFVMSSYLRFNRSEVKLWFFGVLRQSYPELVEKYAELYEHSVGVPTGYKEPAMALIRSLLRRYRLDDMETYHRRHPELTANESPAEAEPVQLSFNF